MTNKTERYFVCSESELEAVCEAARKAGFTYQLDKRVQEAEAACRAREVEPMPPEPDCYLWKEKR